MLDKGRVIVLKSCIIDSKTVEEV